MGGALVGRMELYEQSGMWLFVVDGLYFAVSLLLFLTVHEFGHYFAAKHHRISTSLPYFIPLPFVGVGTLGAVIRIRAPIPSMRKLFDVGASGPLTGFCIAVGILIYALATLPPPSYLMDLGGHEALKMYLQQYGSFPDQILSAGDHGEGITLVVGDTLLYWLLKQFFVNVPPMHEMYHYPFLFAGWLGLFFTALNLLPVGQLDGGHVLYALVGQKWHGRFARGFFILLLISGAVGFIDEIMPALYDVSELVGSLSWFILAAILYFYLNKVFRGNNRLIAPVLMVIIVLVVVAQLAGPAVEQFGYSGWFIWCLLILIIIKIDHPPVQHIERLTPGRRLIAWLSILIFILCFSFNPFYIV